MIQYKWIINRKFDYSTNDLDRVISLIHWKREAKIVLDEEKKDEYSVYIHDAVVLPTPLEDNFIDYDNVTDEDVCNWLDNLYGADYRNEDLKIMLEQEMNKK